MIKGNRQARAELDAWADGEIIFAALEEFRTEVKDEH